MKLKSNLPYYTKLRAKLDADIDVLKAHLEIKETELQNLDTAIASLEKLEGKQDIEPEKK